MDGEVGVGDGLKETKNTALVRAPDTRCRWIDEGVSDLDDHLGTRYLISIPSRLGSNNSSPAVEV